MCGEQGDCQLWDAEHMTRLAVLRGHFERPSSVVISPDGQRVVVANESGAAQVWNAHSGDSVGMLQGQHKALTSVVYSPDGRLIAKVTQTQYVLDPR